MPLVAVSKETRERICIVDTTPTQIRDKHKKGDLVCPFCEGVMIPVAGMIKTPHFRHLISCSHPDARSESVEHIQAKALIYNYLQRIFRGRLNVEICLEKGFPECGKNGRIADVAYLHRDTGYAVVFEVQLSPLSLDTLQERHQDYLSQGIEDVWLFGPKLQRNTQIIEYAEQNLPNGFLPLHLSTDQNNFVIANDR